MTKHLTFVHLELNPETRAMLEQQIEEKLHDLEKHGELDVKIFCSKIAARQEMHGPLFECHALAQARWLTKPIVIRMSGGDCESLIHDCCHHLKVQAVRQTKRWRTRRHQESPHVAS